MSDTKPYPTGGGTGHVHVSFAAPGTSAGGVVGRGYDVGHIHGPLKPQSTTRTDQPAATKPTAENANSSRAQSSRKTLLAANGVTKSYHKGDLLIPVLQNVNLTVSEGEFVAVIGPSGCGKSTLLHLLATLDTPDLGEIHFEGHRIDNLPGSGKDILRNRHFGMIFQFYHLLPELTTLENVLAPAMIGAGALEYFFQRRGHRERATRMLEMVGLGHRLKHKPRELSGGEMQRTAIARALVAQPRVLLADEPTGNLDKATGNDLIALLRQLNREQNLTIVMVTHDGQIAEAADRAITLVDGRIQAA